MLNNNQGFTNSIASYPSRGNHGNANYRGNCTGYIIKDFCNSFLPNGGLLVDPSIGGSTSVDVARELGINFVGTDLSQGYNLLTQDLATYVGQQADCVWWHPPYWDMIKYSGNQWGDEANPWDLSQMNLTDFTEGMILAMMNIHDATKSGGHYGILMGNMRRKGQYYNFSSLMERVAPARLVDEIIKVQHNTTSGNRKYNTKLISIAHEKLMIFKKEATAALYFLSKTIKRLEQSLDITWKAAVRRVLQTEDRKWSLSEVYERIENFAEGRDNKHWKAKVRQILGDSRYFTRIEDGVFELVR